MYKGENERDSSPKTIMCHILTHKTQTCMNLSLLLNTKQNKTFWRTCITKQLLCPQLLYCGSQWGSSIVWCEIKCETQG